MSCQGCDEDDAFLCSGWCCWIGGVSDDLKPGASAVDKRSVCWQFSAVFSLRVQCRDNATLNAKAEHVWECTYPK